MPPAGRPADVQDLIQLRLVCGICVFLPLLAAWCRVALGLKTRIDKGFSELGEYERVSFSSTAFTTPPLEDKNV